jgi:hypothetical protein
MDAKYSVRKLYIKLYIRTVLGGREFIRQRSKARKG